MHIWVDIFTRELIMLALLLALGSGPASFLGERFAAAPRLALAPVLGLCLGTCVFTTLIWFTAARNTYWLVLVLAVLSVTVALLRGLRAVQPDADRTYRRTRLALLIRRLPVRDALALAVVCVVVAAPVSYTLHERHSIGPMGFAVWDAVDYTAEPDGMEQQSIRQAIRPYSAAAVRGFVNGTEKQQLTQDRSNFTRLFWTFYASGDQNLDAAPLSANVNALVGLHGTDTQSLFLIVFLIGGALGAFAAVRYAAPKPSWAAPLAGVLFGGPFFMQLVADGSQAAVCGLSLILPIVVVGVDTLREPRTAKLVVLALLISGLIALYPMFVPGVALAGVVVLTVVSGMAWWRGQLNRRTVTRAATAVGMLVALSVAFNLVSFLRDVRYWRAVLDGAYYSSGLPQYHLPYSVLPGWLLQTREFYALTELGSTSAGQVLIGVIIPAILVAAIAFGFSRRPVGPILVLLVLICAALAEYTSASHNCSYCTDRTLLPIAPLSIGLLALGVAALVSAPRGWLRWVGVTVAVVAVVAVAERTREERVRFANGAYFLDSGSRGLLSRLPSHPGPLGLEGFGQNPSNAPGEFPLVYYLASERNRGEVSVPSEYVDYRGLAYLGESNPANPQFNPGYRYVLTRFAGVQTPRRVIARTGSLALQERASPLDATVVSGVAVPPVRYDGDGLAWVEGPLRMLVVGGSSDPAWISLRFRAIVPVTVPRQPGVVARTATGGVITACVRAIGGAPVRKGVISLSFSPLAGFVPAEPFAVPEPPQGVQLLAIGAVNRCSLTSNN
jgi:hypothetical protein